MDNSLRKWRITHHSNKIGLFDAERQSFINQSGDVVLSFPYRDCVLEWGMSSEEVGREEKFFHTTIDRVDIDVLREPKVLTGFEKIDKDWVYTITDADEVEFFDAEWNLQENLLIKGNNLIALYSLRSRLAGKVKLIYIDPPYNTGNDGFRYNDSFNHSSWLVFMKNRLEIARELLREDGVMLISCDDNEQAYLKVLMDEVFWRENFIANFVWRSSGAGGLRWTFVVKNHEYVLCYCIDATKHEKWFAPYSSSSLADFKEEDENGKFKTQALYLTSLKQTENQSYFIELPDGTLARPPVWIWSWRYIEPTFMDELKLWNIIFKQTKNSPLILKNWGQASYNIYTKQYVDPKWTNPPTWIDEEYVWQTRSSKAMLKNLFDWENVFDYAKPVSLLSFFFKMLLQKNDIVLDFCAWSWTIWHAMLDLNKEDGGNRKCILVEQMNYMDTVTIPRLQKVLQREEIQTSFIHMELRTYNIEYFERIESAQTKEDIHTVYVDMAHNAFLQFWFDRKNWEKDENYQKLTLEDQKIKLRELLDMNQLYLNTGDIYDARHSVSRLDQSITEKFYGKKN